MWFLKGTVEGAVDQLFCRDGENGGKFQALQRRSRKIIGRTAKIPFNRWHYYLQNICYLDVTEHLFISGTCWVSEDGNCVVWSKHVLKLEIFWMINNLSIIAFSLRMIMKNYADQAQAITMPNNKPVTTHQLLTQVTLVNILVLTIIIVMVR